MRAILPLLTRKENTEEYMNKVLDKADEFIVLLVVDKDNDTGKTGYNSSHLMMGTRQVQEIKDFLESKGKTADDVIEWGETLHKITNFAILKKADKILLMDEINPEMLLLFEDLKAALRKEKISVEKI